MTTIKIGLAPLLERFFTERLMQQRPGESAYDQFVSRHLPAVVDLCPPATPHAAGTPDVRRD